VDDFHIQAGGVAPAQFVAQGLFVADQEQGEIHAPRRIERTRNNDAGADVAPHGINGYARDTIRHLP